MGYQPNPIDVAGVEIPADLLALTERLAENTHDQWAETRIAQGWRLGPARSDVKKLHPGLVSYEELPESEKLLDRVTAMGAIKAMLALGYRILPPE